MPKGQKDDAGPGMAELLKMFKELKLGQEDVKDVLRKEMAEMKKEIKQDIEGLKNEIKGVKTEVAENKQGVKELKGEIREIQRGKQNTDNALLNLQLERASFFLRFQNVAEEDGEDLRKLMCKILAEFLRREEERMSWDMDQIYRVNSNYARIHNVPREVHVKFLKRETRDEILRTQRGGALKFKDKQVIILKQIPRKIREMRKRYYFLSGKLYLKGIMFRWLMPEGLLILWEGNRIKIETIKGAEAFLQENVALLEGSTGVEEGEVPDDQMGAAAGPASGVVGGRVLRSRK